MSIPLSNIQRQPTPPLPPSPMPVVPAEYFENPPPVPVWEESKPPIDLSSRKVEVIKERSSSTSSSEEEQSVPPPTEPARETPPSIFELAEAAPQIPPAATNEVDPEDPLKRTVLELHSRRRRRICITVCLIATAVILVVGTITAGACLIIFNRHNRKLRNLGICMIVIPPVVALTGVKAYIS